MRSFDRTDNKARPLSLEPHYTMHADGSVLIAFGNTKVLCTAFMEDRVPGFLKGKGEGWVTGEYGMLPGSTHTRSQREAARGKQSGRTVEISRLIGRSLRACVDMKLLGERSITIDCDVLQADGGTRTAAITGGCLALILCLWKHREKFDVVPLTNRIAAVSLGVVDGRVMVDLDYTEDFKAEVDLNLIMTQRGQLVEIQGTAEGLPFDRSALDHILDLGSSTIADLHQQGRAMLLNQGVEASWVP